MKTVKRHMRKTGIEGPVAQTVLVIILVLLLALTLLPLFITVVMSLKSQPDINNFPFWSFPTWENSWSVNAAGENYSRAFGAVSMPMIKTFGMDLAVTVTVMIMSCYTAFLFQWHKFGANKLLFYLLIAPMLVPGAILLSPTFIVAVRLNIYENNWWGIILPYLAGNQIATVFLLKVFMGQQPDSLYEAARLDGAGKLQLFFHICLPLTYPIMMVQGIGVFGSIYNDYLWPELIFKDKERGTLMPYLRSMNDNLTAGARYAMYIVAGIPLAISTAISIKFFINGEFASGMKL